MPERTRVAVVGGGVAGLAAGHRLARAGCEVTVLERRAQVGGRAAAEWSDGFCLDRGIHILSTADRRLIRWISELGIDDELLPLRPIVSGIVHRGVTVATQATNLSGIARIPGVTWRDKPKLLRLPRLMARYRPLLDVEAPEKAASLDYRSAADFGRLYFGQSLFERWVAPLCAADMNDDEHELSRVAFLLRELNHSRGVAAIARRGLSELVRVAADKLGARVETRIQSLALEPDSRFLLRSRRRHDHAGSLSDLSDLSDGGAEDLEVEERHEVDAVIVACSGKDAGRLTAPLLSPAERDFFAQVSYSPGVTLSLAMSASPGGMTQHYRVPHVEGGPVEQILVEPGVEGGRAPAGEGLLTLTATERFASDHRDADDDTVTEKLRDAAFRLVPRARDSLRFMRLHRGEDVHPHFRVGAYRELARFRRVQADRRAQGRRLYFAGDYLCGPSIENAVSSGVRAADDLLSDLG